MPAGQPGDHRRIDAATEIGGDLDISDSVITDNQACSGAGIRVHDAAPRIQSNAITLNHQEFSCGGTGGGGILVQGAIGTTEIVGNLIASNTIASL